MKQRLNLKALEPKAYEAMYGLEKYVKSTAVSTTDLHLVKVRASQINGCAYCIQLHTKEARKAGETEQRLYALNAWRESPYFTHRERAILALAEEVTLVAVHHVPDAVYEEAVALLGEKYVAQVIMAIVVINAWNRIAISTRMVPET